MIDGISAMDSGAPPVAQFSAGSAPSAGAQARSAVAGAGRGGVAGATSVPRWRVLATGVAERSVDAGATWQAVAVGSAAFFTNGAAPAPAVCWLVGQAGAIFRTTDGSRFDRIDSPALTDWSSIQAIDALRATITAKDGRAFTTTNGGVSWTPEP